MTQDKDNPKSLITLGNQDTGQRQFKVIDNILMLSMTLDCLCPVSWLPNVVNDFGLSLSCVLGA
jgi:hypothetical protein